jgi:hypothetical protein
MKEIKSVSMKSLKVTIMIVLVILTAPLGAAAGGPFGPPQPIAKGTGGLHTGIGYWFHEDNYKDGTDHVTRQNQVYSELGYAREGWEISARVGMSDLKMTDAFRSTAAATTTARADFEDRGNFFTTVGAKGFYPFSETFGLGAFIQGTYYFSDFSDAVSGSRNGAPFLVDLRVKNLWDVNFGLGLQVAAPRGIKIYLGPHVRYSELKASPSPDVAGVALASGERTLKNRSVLGGFAGIELPLSKGFRLNMEGQYTERFSFGAAVLYTY